MFASKASTQVLRSGVRRTAQMTRVQPSRGMAGGKYLYVSEIHQRWGEAFGVVAWLWVFHRARNDLPVMYGFRHPWEHAPDPFAPHHGHGHGGGHASHSDVQDQLEKFNAKAMIQAEVDDDDDDDDDDDEDE